MRQWGWRRLGRGHHSGTVPEHSLQCSSSGGTGFVSFCKEVISPKYPVLNCLRFFPLFFPPTSLNTLSQEAPPLPQGSAMLRSGLSSIFLGSSKKLCHRHSPYRAVATAGSALGCDSPSRVTITRYQTGLQCWKPEFPDPPGWHCSPGAHEKPRGDVRICLHHMTWGFQV